ncbi:MAG TPA: VOC family protein [Pseudonocardiaceae bacterium]|nr:VOC family protein [Pseudonocardiaceae bacterium]
MVSRDTAWPAGTPCWVDLGVDDVVKARTFYSGLFGWDVQQGPPESGGYQMCEIDHRPVAGIGPKMGSPQAPAAWTTYLASDDVDHTAEHIGSAGGTVLVPPMDVMDVGRMALATDPGGAAFGVWQPGVHKGFAVANEPGAVAWNENMSRDYDANRVFYASVFDYTVDDLSADGFQYATLGLGGPPVGGIGGLPPGESDEQIAPHWLTYFAVPDADEAMKRIKELGGSIQGDDAWDSPYGRMAIAADDQGARFAVIALSPPEGS